MRPGTLPAGKFCHQPSNHECFSAGLYTRHELWLHDCASRLSRQRSFKHSLLKHQWGGLRHSHVDRAAASRLRRADADGGVRDAKLVSYLDHYCNSDGDANADGGCFRCGSLLVGLNCICHRVFSLILRRSHWRHIHVGQPVGRRWRWLEWVALSKRRRRGLRLGRPGHNTWRCPLHRRGWSWRRSGLRPSIRGLGRYCGLGRWLQRDLSRQRCVRAARACWWRGPRHLRPRVGPGSRPRRTDDRQPMRAGLDGAGQRLDHVKHVRKRLEQHSRRDKPAC